MSSASKTLKVGTRTSKLALIQAELFVDALRRIHPKTRFQIVGVSTSGDRDKTSAIPSLGQDVFVKELEGALLHHDIDVAVHSLKDLPTSLPEGLTLGAVMSRDDPRDALVSSGHVSLEYLPCNARVGTGSPRRSAQIKALRPDLSIVPVRGNVETRIDKALDLDEVDAVILAAAGLKRLGIEALVSEYFEPETLVPAIGQGFLGIECRADGITQTVIEPVNDPIARRMAEAERAFLSLMGGDCKAPIGAYATANGDQLSLVGMIASLDGSSVLRDSIASTASSHEAGALLKERLVARGAEKFLTEAGVAQATELEDMLLP